MIDLLHPSEEYQDVSRRFLLVYLDGRVNTALHIVRTWRVQVENVDVVIST